jgi:hypothetical protein
MTTPSFIMCYGWIHARRVNAQVLAEQTGSTLIYDEKHSAIDTLRRVMEQMGEGPGILMEDDVIICRDWRARIEAAIAEHPDQAIRFFHATNKQVRMVDGTKVETFHRVSHELPPSAFAWNQCVYLPPGLAAEVVKVCQTIDPSRAPDTAIKFAMMETKKRFWSHVPHLVQHRATLKSGYGPRSTARVSVLFADLLDGAGPSLREVSR